MGNLDKKRIKINLYKNIKKKKKTNRILRMMTDKKEKKEPFI